jgi:hypothetical protein
MRRIDAHAHVLDDPGYIDKLLAAMDECSIERCAISGLGPMFGSVENADVKRLIDTYPDRFIGAWFIRPGVDTVDAVTEALNEGFSMLKVTLPRGPYDDPAFLPIWQKAEELDMPVLFHTGIVTLKGEWPGEGISSWNMHPMRLEAITRECPDLGIIIAHLGVHWNADAAELARMRKNVFIDLTGEPYGWRARLDREGADRYLWWPGAFKKVVFGTDVTPEKIPGILDQDISRLDRLGIDEETQEAVFSGNILKLLHQN